MIRRLTHWIAPCLAVLLLFSVTPAVMADDDEEFTLFGTGKKARDPENQTNQVITIDTGTSPFFGGASRQLGVKIATLDSQLSFKAYYPAPRNCGAGGPRLTLLVDANGDGKFVQFPTGPDFAAHGHVNPPLFSACPQNEWHFENMTDIQVRWEVTPSNATTPPIGPIGGASDVNWDALEAAITAQFPNHRILSGFLVDDAGSPGGLAYFDLVTIGDATLETWEDIDDD